MSAYAVRVYVAYRSAEPPWNTAAFVGSLPLTPHSGGGQLRGQIGERTFVRVREGGFGFRSMQWSDGGMATTRQLSPFEDAPMLRRNRSVGFIKSVHPLAGLVNMNALLPKCRLPRL